MKTIELHQSSDEWLNYRRTRITATDLPVIAANKKLCKNLYHKSLDRLLREKILAPPAKDNKYFAMGRLYEPIILERGDFPALVSNEVLVYEDNPRIMASLDARDVLMGCVVEVKATQKAAGEYDYHKFQIAHQCYVAGLEYGYLLTGFVELYEDGKSCLVRVEKQEVIAADVIEKEDWFKLCTETLGLLDTYLKG